LTDENEHLEVARAALEAGRRSPAASWSGNSLPRTPRLSSAIPWGVGVHTVASGSRSRLQVAGCSLARRWWSVYTAFRGVGLSWRDSPAQLAGVMQTEPAPEPAPEPQPEPAPEPQPEQLGAEPEPEPKVLVAEEAAGPNATMEPASATKPGVEETSAETPTEETAAVSEPSSGLAIAEAEAAVPKPEPKSEPSAEARSRPEEEPAVVVESAEPQAEAKAQAGSGSEPVRPPEESDPGSQPASEAERDAATDAIQLLRASPVPGEPEPEPEPERSQLEEVGFFPASFVEKIEGTESPTMAQAQLGAEQEADVQSERELGVDDSLYLSSRTISSDESVCVDIGEDELNGILSFTIDAAAHGALETRAHTREEAFQAQAPRSCPGGHRLLGARVPRLGFTCDVCGIRVRQGELLYGCRPCNYDECMDCYHQHRPHEGEPPPRNSVQPGDRANMTAQELEDVQPLIFYTDAEIAQMTEQEQLAAVMAMSLQEAVAGNRTASLAQPHSEPTFLCKICYTDEEENTIRLRCGHRWHKECLLQLLRSKVADGKLKILCPDISDEVNERELLGNAREIGCTQEIAKETMFALADELGDTTLQEQYTRFEELDQNPNVRECPVDGCGHRQEGSERSPQMRCEKCGLEYCFIHSAAHPGETCRAYEQGQRRTNADHAKFVKGYTLPCPWCKKPTTKQGGCNHMTCSTCGKEWCWVCGRKAVHHSWHYDDLNVWGCPGMQFVSEFGLMHRYALYTLRVYSIILVLPLCLVGLLTALVSIVVCSPCLLIIFRQGAPSGGEVLRLFLMLGVWPLGLSLALIIMATSFATGLLVLPFACAFKRSRLALQSREKLDAIMVRIRIARLLDSLVCVKFVARVLTNELRAVVTM
jgi:hypothetical protein